MNPTSFHHLSWNWLVVRSPDVAHDLAQRPNAFCRLCQAGQTLIDS
jgi:hypothetical protein